MKAHIAYKPADTAGMNPVKVILPLSKSLSNRLLIINALAGIGTPRRHVAECDDTNAMLEALAAGARADIDVGAAGTAMRFLTAYFATLPGCDVTVDGSERMRQRPIGVLVDALRQLGAHITYTGQEGYPPLHIEGCNLDGGAIGIDACVSSQYTSALLMIAPAMTSGLELTLKGNIVSRPYVDMTIAMMASRGIEVTQQTSGSNHRIIIRPGRYKAVGSMLPVEADWSAASYWYEVTALTGIPFRLEGLCCDSLQGDSVVGELFYRLGVRTTYGDDNSVTIERITTNRDTVYYKADMQLCPDLTQTVAATCCGCGIPFKLTGLSTLPIKETDRLEALKCELGRLGYKLTVSHGCVLEWDGTVIPGSVSPTIETYRDHRMAMAMAPLAARNGELTIDNPEVVSKSYPQYWRHLANAGYQIKES